MNKRFRDMIRQIADEGVLTSIVCKVTKVDKANRLCDCEPVIDEPDILGVRYSVTEGDSSGVILNPVVDSYVIVTMLDDDNGFVSLMTEFESMVIKNDQADLKEVLLKFSDDMVAAIKAVTVPTPAGQSGTPINFASFDLLKQEFETKINQLFE